MTHKRVTRGTVIRLIWMTTRWWKVRYV